MRILFVAAIAALLVFSGCAVSLDRHHRGHYRSHPSRHHSHRGHRHWNAAGPAYKEAAKITEIVILWSGLPPEIEGEFTSADEAKWRRDWPELAARLVAEGLTTRTKSVVTGSFSKTPPTSGYYMTLEIGYLDVGDTKPSADGTPKVRGSALAAHGVIVNAASGAMVADVKFTESSGWTGEVPFGPYMTRVGSSLGDWFLEKRQN